MRSTVVPKWTYLQRTWASLPLKQVTATPTTKSLKQETLLSYRHLNECYNQLPLCQAWWLEHWTSFWSTDHFHDCTVYSWSDLRGTSYWIMLYHGTQIHYGFSFYSTSAQTLQPLTIQQSACILEITVITLCPKNRVEDTLWSPELKVGYPVMYNQKV